MSWTAIGIFFCLVSGASGGATDPELARYDMTGEGTGIAGLNPLRVEGIGLVVGLDGTGSDPPDNKYRTWLMEIMKKRGVIGPADVMRSPNTCIVLLRAYIPPGARKNDLIDIEVWIPPGDPATSLKGGFLLEAEMKEVVIAQGQHIKNDGALQGDTWAKVDGPVLVIDGGAGDQSGAELRKGKILGRGRVVDNSDFRLLFAESRKSERRSKGVAERINQRFRSPIPGSPGVANAINHQTVVLGIPAQYTFNVERFLHVVRRIPMSVSPTFEDRLLAMLESDMMTPTSTIEASLRLEAIGTAAIPVFKEGLLSQDKLVQFCSAQSLAYLKDSSGYKVLAEFGDRSNLYRAYSLAALAAYDHPLSRTHLTRMLDSTSAEARYGAFRSLWMMDPSDPTIRPIILGPDEFSLHLIASNAPPIVHVSQNFRREIVLFNPSQQLLGPLTLRAGDHITVTASANADQVHLYSIRPGPRGPEESRRVSSTSLADVIRHAAEIGASYPDIVDMLMQASAAQNLTSRLEVNALPQPMNLDSLDAIATNEQVRQWDAFGGSTPNLFQPAGEARPSRLEASMDSAPPSEEEEAEPAEEAPSRWRPFRLFQRSAN